MIKQFDVIIIGAGPGGYETAIHAAKEGLSVAIVEKSHLGGTCLNEGCIPTKCFCHDSQIIDEIKVSSDFEKIDYKFSLKKANDRKNDVVQNLRDGISTLIKTEGIALIQGTASFVDSHTIHVEGDISETYSAKNIIIATGSCTKLLPIEGISLPGVYTSSRMLNIDFIPQRLCVIGGGVIGMEFASIFKSFGSQVHVIEFCKEILPPFDEDIAKRLRQNLKKQNVEFSLQSAVTKIEKEGESLLVSYNQKDKEKTTEADVVLMAVGRCANLNSLNLDEVGVIYNKRGIIVDENMQTNIPGIYAVGDINGLCQLAHAASFQGKVALQHILGGTSHVLLDIMPAAVFTNPEVAMVGKTEEQCKAEGRKIVVHKSFYRANGKALSMEASEGLIKILEDEEGYILGAHILGAHAADLIHEIVLAMNLNIKIQQLRDVVHTHPTLSEIILSAI